MNDAPLAHTHDPETSHAAVARLDRARASRVKDAILTMLREEPKAQWELTLQYQREKFNRQWPLVKPDSIAKRLSELHNEGWVVDSKERNHSPYGRPAVVWQINPAMTEAGAA